jgi:hypothetical protein
LPNPLAVAAAPVAVQFQYRAEFSLALDLGWVALAAPGAPVVRLGLTAWLLLAQQKPHATTYLLFQEVSQQQATLFSSLQRHQHLVRLFLPWA